MSSFSDDSESDSETSSFTENAPVRKWDQFRNVPPPVDTGSAVKNKWWIRGERLVKILAYILSFCIVLVSAIVSKVTMFFMIKQIGLVQPNIPFCNAGRKGAQYITDDEDREFAVDFSEETEYDREMRVTERVAWIWAIGFSFCVPQVLALLRSLRKCLFKFNKLPTFKDVAFILLMESCHVTGLSILCFVVLPQMDSANGIVFTTLIALIPSMVLLLSRFKQDMNKESRILWKVMPLDILAIIVQVSGAAAYPIIQYSGVSTALPSHPYPWAMPLGLVLTSCGWWETFTEENSGNKLGQKLWRVKQRMIEHRGSRYATYSIVIPFKIAIFLSTMVYFTYITEAIRTTDDLTNLFEKSFNEHYYKIVEVITEEIDINTRYEEAFEPKLFITRPDPTLHVIYVLLVQIFTSLMAYVSAKFAAKVRIQSIGFSLPLTCVTPLSVVLVLSMCGARAYDKVTVIHELQS